MRLGEAIQKYEKTLREDTLASYVEQDRYIYINESDEDLQKWRIEMPEAPDWGRIENFGLHADDQVFQYEQIPIRLLSLQNDAEAYIMKHKTRTDNAASLHRKIFNETWRVLRSDRRNYRGEIEWLRSQWFYRLFGKFIMIRGQVVYLDGWQWFFLNYWPLEGTGELPDYRWRDMKWFHAQRYAYNSTETVDYEVIKLKSGLTKRKIALLDDGTPRMVDVRYRTLFGTNNLKGRRVGETSKTCGINYCFATEGIDVNCGLQGNTENTARDIYNEKLLYAFNRMPFYFTPVIPNLYHTSGIDFTGLDGRSGLNSRINYAATARKEFYDQKRLDFYHADEAGKTRVENIIERHGVVKRCCTEGALIKGFMIYTSTAEDMEADAGILFERLSEDSMFEERMMNGQTKSGLINVWFSIEESFKGFLDKFGFPIIENPTEDQIPYMDIIRRNDKGEVMGAREYLESVEADLAAQGDLRGLAQFQRQHPKKFKECFSLAIAGNNFNSQILKERINGLKFSKDKKVRTGRYVWVGEPFKSNVIFIDDEEGPWEVSMQLNDSATNQSIVYDGANRMPRFDTGFIISADAYRFDETDNFRESKGSIAVYRMFDDRLDGQKENARDYVTENFVATYLNREATKDLYAEEVLKAALYWNALVYPEINVTIVQDFFVRMGYRGYLHFDVDENGVKKKNCGFNVAGPTSKAKMFTYVDTWINVHGHKCDHRRLLEECLMITGPKRTKDFDLFVAMAGCLLGAASKYSDYVRRFTDIEGVEVGGFFGV